MDILPDTIGYFDTFDAQAHGEPEGKVARVACYSASFEGELIASSEIAEIAFFSFSQKRSTSAPTRLLLDDLNQMGRMA